MGLTFRRAVGTPGLKAMAGLAATLAVAGYAEPWLSGTTKGGEGDDAPVDPVQKQAGVALLLYTSMLIGLRVRDNGANAWYDLLWGCNSAMVLSAIGFLTGRPKMAAAASVVVAIDQFCWYLDILSYLVRGKHLVGVVDYLFYPENRTWVRWATSAHHVWFMPLVLMMLRRSGTKVDLRAWALSAVMTSALGVAARILTPKVTTFAGVKDPVYLNVNAAFEFWQDIKIPFLHQFDKSSPLVYLPFLILVGNAGLNGLPFLVLRAVSAALAKSTP